MTGVNPPLILGLLHPDAYPDPVVSVIVLIETHISWVLLAGNYAYKIKKPVHFDYLDFSTLDLRKHFCEVELAINRHYAPDLYLDVVPITGSPTSPRMQGKGVVIEYAVRMKRFDPSNVLDHLLAEQKVSPALIGQVSDLVANLHLVAPRCPTDQATSQASAQHRLALDNFNSLRALIAKPARLASLQVLEDWTRQQYKRLRTTLAQRARLGFVRTCHGDLHLGNIVLLDGHPTPFDAIEFSEALRTIDTLDEAALLMVDLEVHHAAPLAYQFLNRYLTWTGDYEGLKLLDYYRLYRTMVRAKIRCQSPPAGTDAGCYIDYGLELIHKPRPLLLITHGCSGSGKTSLAISLAARIGAIHLSSDVERKRLAGLPLQPDTVPQRASPAIYQPEHTEATYRHLLRLAALLTGEGHSVVLDATFLQQNQRNAARQTAQSTGAMFLILDLQAPQAVITQRIKARLANPKEFSDAGPIVLDWQLTQQEPLALYELLYTLRVDTTMPPDIEALTKAIESRRLEVSCHTSA